MSVQSWYAELPAKEKKLVLVAAVVIALALLWFAIWQPIWMGAEQQQQAAQKERENLEWVREKTATLMALNNSSASGSRGGQNFTQLLSNTAGNRGLSLSRVQEKGANEVQIWLDNTSFDDLMLWLQELQTGYGVMVGSININQTDESGLVRANAKLISQG